MNPRKKFHVNPNVFITKIAGRQILLWALLLAALAGCVKDGDRREDDKTASVYLNIVAPQGSRDKTTMKPIGGASDVKSVIAVIKEGAALLATINEADWDLSSGHRAKNVAGLPTASPLSFNVRAFNGLDGQGDEIFAGSAIKVLTAGDNNVAVNMAPLDDGDGFEHMSIVGVDYPATMPPLATMPFIFSLLGKPNQSFSWLLDSSGDGSFSPSSGDAVLGDTGRENLSVYYTAPVAAGEYYFTARFANADGAISQTFKIAAQDGEEPDESQNPAGALRIFFPPAVKTTDAAFNQYDGKLALSAITDPTSGLDYSWRATQGKRSLVLAGGGRSQAFFNGYNSEAALRVRLTVGDSDNGLGSSVEFSLRPKTFVMIERSSWRAVGGAAVSERRATGSVELAVDNAAAPHVVYNYQETKIKALKFSDGSWSPVGALLTRDDILNLPDATGETLDLAMDSLSLVVYNDSPYLAWRDQEPGPSLHKAAVIKFNGVSWEAVGTSRVSDGPADSLSLAVSSGGTLYLAYKDETNGGKATVKQFSGGSWLPAGAGPASDQPVDSLKLVVDNETPYLAYSYERTGNVYIHPDKHYKRLASAFKAEIKKFNGVSWETLGASPLDSDGDQKEVLVMDAADSLNLAVHNGVAYFAYNGGFSKPHYCRNYVYGWGYYCHYINSYKAKVKKFEGGDWAIVGDLDEDQGGASASITARSLAIGGDGAPCLAYTGDADNSRAGVKKFNGYFWERVGAKGLSEAAADFLKVAVDNGVPYIIYLDSAGDAGPTVKKFE